MGAPRAEITATARRSRRGRPKKQISAQQVEKIAQLGATHQEMADFFDCDRATLERNFAAEIDKGKAALKMRLRRLQLRAASKGSVAMLIWLGKTVLRQSEKAEPESPQIRVFVERYREPSKEAETEAKSPEFVETTETASDSERTGTSF